MNLRPRITSVRGIYQAFLMEKRMESLTRSHSAIGKEVILNLRIIAAGIVVAAIVYSAQIANGFTILGGDRFDAVISASIMEHWRLVFLGLRTWSDVGYFYPHPLTIAHTDAFLLVSIPFSLLRALGMDPLLAQEVTGILLRSIGFWGMWLFCRRALGLSEWGAVAAAAYFCFAVATTAFAHRPQLMSVMLTPLLALMVLFAIRNALRGDSLKFAAWGSGAGAFFGVLCLTSFYVAWFFLFLLGLFFVTAACIERKITIATAKAFMVHWRSCAIVVSISLIFGAPFIYAFGLKSMDVGARSWDSIRANLVDPINLVLMHPSSVGGYFGEVLRHSIGVTSSDSGEYARIGFSPIVIVILLSMCFWRRPESAIGRFGRVLAFMIVAGAMLLVDWGGGISGWRLVFETLPGASALNVASALLIVLTLPVAIAVGVFFNERGIRSWVATALVTGMVFLEIHKPYLNLHRADQMAFLTVPMPPQQCKVFYVGPLTEQRGLDESTQWLIGTYPHNVAALFISQSVGILTINGFASFVPNDWNFSHPARADYEDRISAYAARHSLSGSLRAKLA